MICISSSNVAMLFTWGLTPLSTILQLYRGCQFYWWGIPDYPEKAIALSQVTDNHIMLYRVHIAWAGFELTTLVVIGTDYIGSCKSNYDTITTTTAPKFNWQHELEWHTKHSITLDIVLSYKRHVTFKMSTGIPWKKPGVNFRYRRCVWHLSWSRCIVQILSKEAKF